MPDLDFAVIGAEVLLAAVPTLAFRLSVHNAPEDERIDSIMLRLQIRIEPTRRQYDAAAQARLGDLFGRPEQWGESLRSFLWTHATAVVPGFSGSAEVEVPVACTYDFEVTGSKYLSSLESGEVPLLFLFSGTVFYRNGGRLQIGQIPWEKEAAYRMPVALWKEAMDRHFPNSAWLRLQRDIFDRLYAYRVRRGLPSWDAAVESLLEEAQVELESGR